MMMDLVYTLNSCLNGMTVEIWEDSDGDWKLIVFDQNGNPITSRTEYFNNETAALNAAVKIIREV